MSDAASPNADPIAALEALIASLAPAEVALRRGAAAVLVRAVPPAMDHPRRSPGPERAAAARITHPGRRAAYLAGRALLRQGLAALPPRPSAAPLLSFAAGPGGKPCWNAPTPPFRFNLSHAGGHLALALSLDGEIGVDLEPLAPIDPGDFPRDLLAPAEQAALAAAEGLELQRRFFRLWTRKEALLKRDDNPATVDWSKIDVSLDRPDLQDRPLILDGRSFWLAAAWPNAETVA